MEVPLITSISPKEIPAKPSPKDDVSRIFNKLTKPVTGYIKNQFFMRGTDIKQRKMTLGEKAISVATIAAKTLLAAHLITLGIAAMAISVPIAKTVAIASAAAGFFLLGVGAYGNVDAIAGLGAMILVAGELTAGILAVGSLIPGSLAAAWAFKDINDLYKGTTTGVSFKELPEGYTEKEYQDVSRAKIYLQNINNTIDIIPKTLTNEIERLKKQATDLENKVAKDKTNLENNKTNQVENNTKLEKINGELTGIELALASNTDETTTSALSEKKDRLTQDKIKLEKNQDRLKKEQLSLESGIQEAEEKIKELKKESENLGTFTIDLKPLTDYREELKKFTNLESKKTIQEIVEMRKDAEQKCFDALKANDATKDNTILLKQIEKALFDKN